MSVQRSWIAAATAALLAGAAGAAQAAQITGLYDTGVTAAGTPAAYGAAELHYTIIGGPADRVANDPATYPDNVWIGPDGTSYWIGPNTDAALDAGPVQLDYRTTFTLTALQAATADITGQWAVDDEGLDILINGQSTHQTAQWNTWTGFSIGSGFVAGVNTLDFIVQNDNYPSGPTGLRVEMTGTAEGPAAGAGGVPEPAAWALMLVGFGGLGAMLRRRRRAAFA